MDKVNNELVIENVDTNSVNHANEERDYCWDFPRIQNVEVKIDNISWDV